MSASTLVEMQVVQLADNLGEHRRLVDHQPRAVHEVRNASGRKLGMKRKDFLPHPVHQPLAVERMRPGGPAQEFARNGLNAPLGGIARVVQGPVALEDTNMGFGARPARGTYTRSIRRLVHVEVDQKAQLFGVLGRVGVTASEQVVADAVDPAPEFRGHGHLNAFIKLWAGCHRAGQSHLRARTPPR